MARGQQVPGLTQPPDDEDEVFHAAIDALERIEYGRFLDDCDNAVTEMVKELYRALDKGVDPKGTITIKLDLKLQEGGAMALKGDLAVTKPRYPRKTTFVFATQDGEIVGSAPQQLTMFGDRKKKADADAVMGEPTAVVSPVAAAPVDAVAVAPAAPVAAPAVAMTAPAAVAPIVPTVPAASPLPAPAPAATEPDPYPALRAMP